MTRILHLSDLHFGDGGHHFTQGDASSELRSTLVDAIVTALERDTPTAVDQLVISGDLLNHEQASDLPHAKDGIQALIERLGIDPQQVLCVPGNHDLTWDSKWANKFRFYDELLESAGVRGLTVDMPLVVPTSGEGARPLAFVLLNSCRIETRALAGLGKIGQKQIQDLKQRLKDAGVSADTHTIVAIMHHHLLPIVAREENLVDPQATEQKKVGRPSLVVDAVRTLHCFAEAGISLVLHGHQHQPAVLRYEDVLHTSPPIGILAAGSCGTSTANVRRHFFVIDLGDDRADIHSYDQADNDADRFERGRKVELALGDSSTAPASSGSVPSLQGELTPKSSMPVLNGFCPADYKGRNIDTLIEFIEEDGEDPTDDSSDLCVIMLSVADCPTARKTVRRALEELPHDRLWQRLGKPQLSLLGMYDLLGNWDLALRLRIGNGTSPTKIANYLDKRLQEANQRKGKGHFSEMSVLDVGREAGSIRGILTPGSAPVERRTLGETKDYDLLRCQRSFVWIELGVHRNEVLAELANAIEGAPEVSAIVESANLDDQVLLLETFCACGQSSEIAHLNRLVEPVLASWERQKYTLTCYGYDEGPLLVEEPVPA